MKILTILSIILCSTISVVSQDIDQEPEFIYRKATYLMETNRYDDAIQELNKIIAKDASYKDVLYQRALAKFNLAAYPGTKKDLLAAFEVVGISPEAVLLFGKAQKNMGEQDASAQTMITADILYPNGSTPRKKSDNRNTNQDSNTDSDASDLEKIEDKITEILSDILPKRDGSSNDNDGETNDGGQTRRGDTGTNGNEPTTRQPDNTRIEVDTKPQEPVYVEDTSERKIVIDEDLTLVIKNGLGNREIKSEPSILMLAQTSGTVVVDICVNSDGKVVNAEYNSDESTLKTQSLITLAQRKSKEFFFERSSQDEICGTILFQITGSN